MKTNLIVVDGARLPEAGGIQNQTTVLRRPCVSAAESAERPRTVENRTDTIGGITADAFKKAIWGQPVDEAEGQDPKELRRAS
jgi:UDP-N-acetylglucosamine 2-epimerase